MEAQPARPDVVASDAPRCRPGSGVRSKSWQIAQCAIAAGVAWFIAADLLGHQTPFFAPIAAVVSLGTSYGQRLRRVAEVTLGVAVGVLLADLLVVWHRLGLVAAHADRRAGDDLGLLLDGGQLLVIQAAVQSIVVSALCPRPGRGARPRGPTR